MYKVLFILALVTSSFASHAQSSMDDSSLGKTEGTFPELKTAEATESKWSAGVSSGVNSPKGDAGSSTEFGVILGFRPIASVVGGIEANTTRLNNDNEVRQTNVLLRSTYNFGGDVPILSNSFIGAGVGPVFVSNRVRWAAAPLVGFDIPLSSKKRDFVSLGLEAKYLFISKTDVPNLFAAGVALKYWF